MEAYYKNLSIEDIPGEIWKDISGYEGLYQVSNYGRVKGLERKARSATSKTGYRIVKSAIIQQSFTPNQEFQVSLTKDGKRKTLYAPRLTAQTFIPNPYNEKFVRLIIPINEGGNTAISNLQWGLENSKRKKSFTVKAPTKKSKPIKNKSYNNIWVWPEGTPVWERRLSKKKLILAQKDLSF